MPLLLLLCYFLFSHAAFALEVGDKFPEISGELGRGTKQIQLLSLQGKNKPMVVAFFSVTCIPCIREAPELEALRVKFKNQAVAFVYVNLDPPRAEKQIATFVKKTKSKLPIFYAEVEKVKKTYEAYGMPKLILLDGRKKIIKIYEGYHPDLKEQLSSNIVTLLQ